ncbi:hypothetical protein [Streptomyces roseicoloratus]|uniref:hypothetical protein n=1 Tax=Streptomyces roseicoloratus TaxID=2508722 RepID=UPI001009D374|nr:hypothetical protein [Streptomyces roseicoloratus]
MSFEDERAELKAATQAVLFGNHRIFIMGILGVMAGVVGAAAGITEGAGILEILSFVGIGVLGLTLIVGYVIFRPKEVGGSGQHASARSGR